MTEKRNAILYRMILPEHTCPYGVKARTLLEQHGYDIEEHILASRQEVDAFQSDLDVGTTPQVFIGGDRIGGSDELERFLTKA